MRAFGKKTELQRDIVECKYQLNMHCHMPAPSRSVRRQGEPVRSCRSKELELTRARGSSPAAPAGAGAITQLTTGAAKPPVQAMAAQNASFSLQAQRRAGSRAAQGAGITQNGERNPNQTLHTTNLPAPTAPHLQNQERRAREPTRHPRARTWTDSTTGLGMQLSACLNSSTSPSALVNWKYIKRRFMKVKHVLKFFAGLCGRCEDRLTDRACATAAWRLRCKDTPSCPQPNLCLQDPHPSPRASSNTTRPDQRDGAAAISLSGSCLCIVETLYQVTQINLA